MREAPDEENTGNKQYTAKGLPQMHTIHSSRRAGVLEGSSAASFVAGASPCRRRRLGHASPTAWDGHWHWTGPFSLCSDGTILHRGGRRRLDGRPRCSGLCRITRGATGQQFARLLSLEPRLHGSCEGHRLFALYSGHAAAPTRPPIYIHTPAALPHSTVSYRTAPPILPAIHSPRPPDRGAWYFVDAACPSPALPANAASNTLPLRCPSTQRCQCLSRGPFAVISPPLSRLPASRIVAALALPRPPRTQQDLGPARVIPTSASLLSPPEQPVCSLRRPAV